MTSIETANTGHSTTIRVHGDLNAEQVSQLERCWRTNCKETDSLHLDLCNVREIDAAGKSLITRMFAAGVELVVRSRRRS
jgi:ABC-type transporter Mla MlaB component